jgi:hypothetical protein
MDRAHQRQLLDEDVHRVAASIAAQLRDIATHVMDHDDAGPEFPDRLASFTAFCGQLTNPADAGTHTRAEVITFPLGEYPTTPEVEQRLRDHTVWQRRPDPETTLADLRSAAERICSFLTDARAALGRDWTPPPGTPHQPFWINCGHQAGHTAVENAVTDGTPGDFSIAFPLQASPTPLAVEQELAQRSYWRARLCD